jgi:hypothetical protein
MNTGHNTPFSDGMQVVLHIDGLRLVIEQRAVAAVVSAAQVARTLNGHGPGGHIADGEDRWPVYALTADLRVTAGIPQARRHCALLAVPGQKFGIFCDQAESVDPGSWVRHPVPACMHTADMPFSALGISDGEVWCVMDAAMLSALIENECSGPDAPQSEARV